MFLIHKNIKLLRKGKEIVKKRRSYKHFAAHVGKVPFKLLINVF